MEKQEVLDKLETIRDVLNMDFLNRQELEGIITDIDDLIFEINVNTKDF